MILALPQKFPFILDRNLAKANCTGNHVCMFCDTVVHDFYIIDFYNLEIYDPIMLSLDFPQAKMSFLRSVGCFLAVFVLAVLIVPEGSSQPVTGRDSAINNALSGMSQHLDVSTTLFFTIIWKLYIFLIINYYLKIIYIYFFSTIVM